MRKLISLSLMAGVAAFGVGGIAAATKPTLRLVDDRPLIVRGTAFRPDERVTITAVTATGSKRSITRASAHGTFRTTLHVAAQPCGRVFLVVAVGRAGSRATLQVGGAPCVPPPLD